MTHEKHQTLKGALAGLRDRGKRTMVIEALRGVSFEVPAGSVYGVIGRNGAGKTTLFRTLAGILPPTYGRVTVWGRVTPLLSLGVGFNRELTGRDNILLGGLTRGLRLEEVYANFDAVEEFAGLGDAIDFPMRTYSSGMFGRLAFSVAAHLRPEILLIDEALAAGDAAFKLKSMDKIRELCEPGLHRVDRVARPRGREGTGRALRLARSRNGAVRRSGERGGRGLHGGGEHRPEERDRARRRVMLRRGA